MNSPITGKEMTLATRMHMLKIRGEDIPVIWSYYLCEDSKEQFTDNATDSVTVFNGYMIYLLKNNLPLPEFVQTFNFGDYLETLPGESEK